MSNDDLHTLLRDAEDRSFRFTFQDGRGVLAKVVSATHVDADDTILILRVGCDDYEPGYQVHLADIRSLAMPDGRSLYEGA